MKGKIHVITSLISGNGAKYVTTNLAYEALQKDKTAKILLVDFDFENPYLCYEHIKFDTVHGIDNIMNNLSGEGLSQDMFQENIIRTDIGIDVLRGTKFSDKRKDFQRNMIETILNYSKELYQDIFVVVGSAANNAGTVYSLLTADDVLVVMRDNNANSVRVEKTIKMIGQYTANRDAVYAVYNLHNRYTRADVSSKLAELEIEVLGVLEYDEKSIDNINLTKSKSPFSLRDVNGKVYESILAKLCK